NRDSKSQALIPAHFIRELTVEHNKNVIMTGNTGANISKDPYFAFMLKGGNPGDKITIRWIDNLGNEDTQDHIIN
ncbi:MAG: thiosulfate oxidation carrier complex protein SoxZ, partial [Methylobacter sp.]